MAGLCLKGILGGCRAIKGATWWPPPARDEVTEFLPDISPAQLAAVPQPPVSASPQPVPGRGQARSHREPGPRPAAGAREGCGDTPVPLLMLDSGNVSRAFREEESEEGGRDAAGEFSKSLCRR